MKLAVFDFDSTLMDGETIDFLAEELGIGEQVTKITEEAMSGRLDFFESLTTRVALLKGMDYQKVVDICADLPLDADFSNVLHEKDGKLTGLIGGDMMFGYSKGDMLQRIQGLMGITRADTLVCGDGANDLSMFAHADTRVAFCAREVLKKEANIVIDTKDLTKILDYVKA